MMKTSRAEGSQARFGELSSKKILLRLEKEQFARWYEDKFVPFYIQESKHSEEEILQDIRKMFEVE